jgi:hypothetical protein
MASLRNDCSAWAERKKRSLIPRMKGKDRPEMAWLYRTSPNLKSKMCDRAEQDFAYFQALADNLAASQNPLVRTVSVTH